MLCLIRAIGASPEPHQMVAEVAEREKIIYSGVCKKSGFVHPHICNDLEKQLHDHRTTIVQGTTLIVKCIQRTDLYSETCKQIQALKNMEFMLNKDFEVGNLA